MFTEVKLILNFEFMKEKKRKIQRLTPAQLDVNYNKYMKDKKLVANGKYFFEKIIKKATDKNKLINIY